MNRCILCFEKIPVAIIAVGSQSKGRQTDLASKIGLDFLKPHRLLLLSCSQVLDICIGVRMGWAVLVVATCIHVFFFLLCFCFDINIFIILIFASKKLNSGKYVSQNMRNGLLLPRDRCILLLHMVRCIYIRRIVR